MHKLIVAVFIIIVSLKAHATQEDLYDFLWLDPDKKVYVLQNKVYEKKGSFYANVGVGQGLSTDFQDTLVTQGKLGWFFEEEWGVELIYSNKSHSDDDAYSTVTQGNGKVPFIRRFNNYYGVMGIWSPFYGKINTFNNIYYFDLNFGLGISKIQAESNRRVFNLNALASQNEYDKEDFTGATWKGQLRFYVNKKINIDLDVITNTYKANSGLEVEEKFRNNTDAVISVGFSF